MDFFGLLERVPDRVRSAVLRTGRGEGVLGRLADALRYRRPDAGIPAISAESVAPVKVFIGPVNSAGQGFLWMRSLERSLPGVEGTSFQGTPGVFAPEVDIRVPHAAYRRSREWHRRLAALLETQTHIIWESGYPMTPTGREGAALKELAGARQRGAAGALLFHGSDIRPPLRHAEAVPWSPFASGFGPVRVLDEGVRRNNELIARADAPVFVSTPDLLRWVPQATWVPVVVDPSRWASRSPTEAGRRPVVVHAPSHTWLKGTGLIEPTLLRLSAEGVIEYRRVTGVPHAAMTAVYQQADVVLDQFALGSYGVAACEAMAAGKVVVGHVDDHARGQVRDLTGLELPIVEASPDSLERVLRSYAAAPEEYELARAEGTRFVSSVHNGDRSATALAPFLGLSG